MSKKNVMSARKQSLIAGGLISTAGLFLSKFIGLLYMSPFQTILGGPGENLANYSLAYNLYAYLLMIATAGFPFAIATLVAKYMAREDYRSVLMIKKISSYLMASVGFSVMILVILFSTPLSHIMMGNEAGSNVTKNVLIIISFALFFVPFLSSIRGFYQGMKEMQIYSFSQVLEQLVRIAFLLISSSIAVYIMHLDRVWAVYLGVASASISAIAAYLHLKYHDRKTMCILKTMAAKQTVQHKLNKKLILKELVFISFPFLLSSIFGYSDMVVNTLVLREGMLAHGNTAQEYEIISGIINGNVMKLVNIPQILAPGFSSAIIPHLTVAIEQKNYGLIRKNMQECIELVIYIALPICFALFLFSKGIYAVLYQPVGPNAEALLNLGAEITSWFSIEALLSSIVPVITTLMLAAKLRKRALIGLVIYSILKIGTSYPCLVQFGYSGLVISSVIGISVHLTWALYSISKYYNIQWKYTLRKIMFMCIGLLGVFVCGQLFAFVGIDGFGSGRLINLVELALVGGSAMVVYFIITYSLQLPQILLHIDLNSILKRFKKS